jgi:chromosome segregation ATPase
VVDLEQLEDHNHDLIARVHSTEQELQKRQEVIVSMEQEREELREVNVELADEAGRFEGVRRQLVQEINDRESLISSYVP